MRIIADLCTFVQPRKGADGVAALAAAAMVRSLEAVAVVARAPARPAFTAAVRDVDRRAPAIRVLAGVSCHVITSAGDLNVPREAYAGFDLVVAGARPAARFGLLAGFRRGMPAADAIVSAVYRHEIDILTDVRADLDPAELARACRERGVALELRARGPLPPADFVRRAARLGARFVITSGARVPAEMGDCTAAVRLAREAGVAPEQVVNAEQGGLWDWLEAQRRRRRLVAAGGWAGWARQGGAGAVQHRRVEERQPSDWADWSERGGEVH
ncbi:hypothetical protein [Symbiobacterium terraclitae]|uniref:hypothetical protein n=1 Tax=Symbiobacterium terraclitae TaxID=557451 RepID=UPI0035B56B4A